MSAKNRGTKVIEHEFYPTPRSAIEPFLLELKSQKVKQLLWGEPCAGDNSIINEMWRIHKVEPSMWDWCEIREGKDYLTCGLNTSEGIITNPPFSLATKFISKSLEESIFTAYLLRLNFWGSQKRKEWWDSIIRPSHQFTLSERPSFTGKGTDATEYAWFVWDWEYGVCKREPGMYVI